MISLCVITRNEARSIGAMLQSVHGLVAQIIVVDACSTDETAAIAQSCGATVINRPWTDDFAAARNASLEQATQPWILVLDADETLDVSAHDVIRSLTSGAPRGIWLKRKHYCPSVQFQSAEPLAENDPARALGATAAIFTDDLRLFPNDARIRFTGIVHETVEDAIHRHAIPQVRTDLLIHHYGHLSSIERQSEKAHQYAALAAKKAAANPDDWRAHLQHGIELQGLQRHEEAADSFRRSITLYDKFGPTWRHLGISLFALGEIPASLRALQEALRLNEGDLLTWNSLGVKFFELEQFDEAEICFRTILDHQPHDGAAQAHLTSVRTARQTVKEPL